MSGMLDSDTDSWRSQSTVRYEVMVADRMPGSLPPIAHTAARGGVRGEQPALCFCKGRSSTTRFEPLCARNAALSRVSYPIQTDIRYPSASEPLKITIDIRYQYAIMVSLGWHDPFVPCEPCAPATRSF